MTGKPHVVILGAGPAGLGAAYRLAQRDAVQVTVLERQERVGGNAGSFELAGVNVDYGSHRLHPTADPAVLADVRRLLGDDLLIRPRHGRIRLRGRWLHFPLKPLDLGFRLPPAFALGVASDLTRRALQRHAEESSAETFASVLEAGLGGTICRDFYFPYARKLWGLEPEELSSTQARRRVSAGSPARMLRKVLEALPGLRPAGAGTFYYPRWGFGQISAAFARAATEAGAEIRLGAMVDAVSACAGGGFRVHWIEGEGTCSCPAERVWSTIPVTALARCLQPAPPARTLEAAEHIDYRAMILIYLVLGQDRFSEYDAHYFPESDIAISRLSEPKNYGDGGEPRGTTVLCAELPCSPADPAWQMTDDELGRLACDALAVAAIPIRSPVRQVTTRRLRQAYPIYRRGYEVAFAQLDAWLGGISGLLTFGRQGLFAHDNTHHALAMGYRAADCMDGDGRFDHERWQTFRRDFEKHVVED